MKEAKAKTLFKHDNGDLDFRIWRAADITKLCTTIRSCSTRSLNEEVSQDILELFKHEFTVCGLHEITGFSFFSVASSSDSSAVERTIATLARLDAFLATTITCLRADGSDKVGSLRQKFYSETVLVSPSIAFA